MSPVQLSYSRLSRYERCPRSYARHYLACDAGQPCVAGEREAADLGSAVHRALELVVREACEAWFCGAVDDAMAVAAWGRAWAESGLSGASIYARGLELVRDWAQDEGELDSSTIVGVEVPFAIDLGDGVTLRGVIDRVNRLHDGTLEIVDYKTNRAPYSRSDVEESEQLGIYAIAAQTLWPGQSVRLCYQMLSFGSRHYTERTPSQLADLLAYLRETARQIEHTDTFAERLNQYCSSCEYRGTCASYAKAASCRLPLAAEVAGDVDALAAEHSQLVDSLRLAHARKDELDAALRARAEAGPLTAFGRVYEVKPYRVGREYALRDVLALASVAGENPLEFAAKVASVDRTALTRELASRADGGALGKQIEAVGRDVTSSRFSSRKAPK
jgi:RecB family exonuclease